MASNSSSSSLSTSRKRDVETDEGTISVGEQATCPLFAYTPLRLLACYIHCIFLTMFHLIACCFMSDVGEYSADCKKENEVRKFVLEFCTHRIG
jgi:hypothetical protein